MQRLIFVFCWVWNISLAGSWVLGQPSVTVSLGDLKNVIRHRGEALETYHLKAQRIDVSFPLNALPRIRQKLGAGIEIDQTNARGSVSNLLGQLEADKSLWTPIETYVSNRRVKLIEGDNDDPQQPWFVHYYDGENLQSFSPRSSQKQVDIRPNPDGNYLDTLDQLGIDLRRFLKYECRLVADPKEPILVEFIPSANVRTRISFGQNLAPTHLTLVSSSDNTVLLESWYFGLHSVDGFPMPKVICTVYPGSSDMLVRIHLLDQIEINCEIPPEQMKLGPLPPWAVIVDHRQTPPTAVQLMPNPYVHKGVETTFGGKTSMELPEIEQSIAEIGSKSAVFAATSRPSEEKFRSLPRDDMGQTAVPEQSRKMSATVIWAVLGGVVLLCAYVAAHVSLHNRRSQNAR